MEERGKVEAFVTPVGQIAAGGAVAGARPVDVEDEAIVGADADYIRGWSRGEGESTAEMEDYGITERGSGVGDPAGFPVAMRRIGWERRGLGSNTPATKTRRRGPRG